MTASSCYTIADKLRRGAGWKPYKRERDDPQVRPLQIYAVDPATDKREGATATVEVPYEPLEPGPKGKALWVHDVDASGQEYAPVDLEQSKLLLNNGISPTPVSPQFRQQMVYAVASRVRRSFRLALGRQLDWGFTTGGGPEGQLKLRPQGSFEENAFYDKSNGCISFGYYRTAASATGRYLPNGFAFTALSHDIIAHEVTHALLDGLRSNFMTPSSPDTLAFHEGFADLIAVFHHFSYEEVVLAALQHSNGQVDADGMLTAIANYFGHTTEGDGPLRSAIDMGGKGFLTYDDTLEIHKLGSVLVSAVFDAFTTIYNRRVQPYILLATQGAGLKPKQLLPPGLDEVLARIASTVAEQFLNVIIRAIDYCPPVDLEFGDFLRAVITADRELVADDPWGYREAWINAFARRKIYPKYVEALSEDALLWHLPRHPLPRLEALSFAKLQFQGDPGNFFSVEESLRQARALGDFITARQNLTSFGLMANGDPALDGDTVEPPSIESIRVARRTGPDGQVLFSVVAEVVQRRHAHMPDGQSYDHLGGCTIIVDESGDVRYSIYKSAGAAARLRTGQAYLAGSMRHYWATLDDGSLSPVAELFRRLH